MMAATTIRMLALAFSAVLTTTAGDSVLDVGSRKQLFIDYKFIESAEGVTLIMNPPARTGGIVIQPDAPWENGMAVGSYSSVIRENGKVRVWYGVLDKRHEPHQNPDFMGVAYAESADGIHFVKPRLGLVEHNGSRQNNLVFPVDPTKLAVGGGSVWIDENPACPPDERYKSWQKIYPKRGTGIRGPHRIFVSPDGIRWRLSDKLVTGLRAADTQPTWFWDPRLKRYIGYSREWARLAPGGQFRLASYNESDDMFHWRGMQIVLSPDEIDFTASIRPLIEPREMTVEKETWTPVLQPKAAVSEQADRREPDADQVPVPGAPLDIYGPGVFRCEGADDVYIALMSTFHHWDNRVPDSWPDTGNVRLAVSRDGRHFQNPGGRQPFLRLGPAGAFDSRWVWALPRPVRMADELWVYYFGGNRDHASRLDPDAPGGAERTGISRAVMRADGFVSADFDYAGGSLITPPVRFAGSRLELNIDTGGGGVGRVELFHADGSPLPGFTLADADQISTNNVRAVASWRGNKDISALAGKPVRLHFKMRAAKLYAFQFR
ncbi:MAG: hypothetical protein IT160_18260 [Bryobacterales bacterium]|nr:hypothetical protein [Bryobacterales bacterium]